jgi:DNA topoisomerase-3
MKLVIAEKPSVAMSIANVIGANNKCNGYCKGNDYIVTWCVGHLIESATPEDYNPDLKEWSLDTLPILPQPYKLRVSSATEKQFMIVKELINSDEVTSLVCATDAGREGELIFRLVYNYIGCSKPFERLWISSMENSAIKDGFNNLQSGDYYDNLYRAAYARLRSDWYFGINFSRLYSKSYEQKLNVGRVQVYVVNRIVERQLEIDNFKPVPYYILEADCGDLVAKSEKYSTIEAANAVVKICDKQSGKITQLEEKQHKDNPPTLFDLTSLQREASKMFGYTPQQVLDNIQSLYEKKLLTYPRTDSKYLTEDMVSSTKSLIEQLLKSHLVDTETKAYVKEEKINLRRVIDNSKVSDHHAIIPTATLLNKDVSNLTKTEINCLNLVIYRLIAATYTPCIYNETSVTLDVAGKEFYAKGKKIIDSGYITVLNNLKNNSDNKDTSIPSSIELNKVYDSVSISLTEKKTSAPKPYDDDSLLSAMENAGSQLEDDKLSALMKECKGIGTPATRAGIIEKVINVGYIERKNKVYAPTQKGYSLIKVLPDEIKSIEMTAHWEQQLELISKGKLSDEEFIQELFEYITSICNEGKKQEVDKSLFKQDNNVIGICPRCGKNVVEYSKSFSCESGKNGCGFTMWKNDRFWLEKKKTLTAAIAKKLLNNGTVKVKGLYSAKKDKKYDATVSLVDTGKYVNYKLLF